MGLFAQDDWKVTRDKLEKRGHADFPAEAGQQLHGEWSTLLAALQVLLALTCSVT
jgi:hypothetical protein